MVLQQRHDHTFILELDYIGFGNLHDYGQLEKARKLHGILGDIRGKPFPIVDTSIGPEFLKKKGTERELRESWETAWHFPRKQFGMSS